LVLFITPLLPAQGPSTKALLPSFDATVLPVLSGVCGGCHNDRVSSGGLNLESLSDSASMRVNRDEWDLIVRRVEAGEMPPVGVPRKAAEIDAMVSFLKAEFRKADLSIKPDPGRTVARRLNRVEYANTIRDLLGVSYRSDKEFPRDDEGEGFDDIADLLTTSPVLAEKYMSAAAEIAAKSMGAEKLPSPSEFGYMVNQDPKVKKSAEALIYYGQDAWMLDASTLELKHHIDYDGDYQTHIDMAGSRGETGEPVTLKMWMDGKLIHQMKIETKPPKITGFQSYPYSGFDIRLPLPAGDHVFRVGIVDDPIVKGLADLDAYNPRKNIFPYGVKFYGPYKSKMENASRKRILICDPKTGAACTERIVGTLARRAFRRPVTKDEVAPLMRFVKMAETTGQGPEQGIQNALRAMLVSPNFLFRIERDPGPRDAAKVHQVSSVELASRLSYFLWSSMPDDQLLEAAETGKLHNPDNMRSQVERMISDPRSSALGENFAGQWLQLRNLNSIRPDPDKFPAWGPALREEMLAETRMFFDYVLRENRPVSDFLDARYTFLDEGLAKHYGIPNVTGTEFRKVELTTDQRGGIMTQAGVLAVSSYPTRTSVVLRGKYVLDNILNTPPPPPPPDVPMLNEESVGTTASLRQQMESHRANPACAGCHNKMDPIGFALENYDPLGCWRTMDGKFPIDASGKLPAGKSYSNAAEFRAALAAKTPEFARALTEKLLIYALGRALQRSDRPAVDRILEQTAPAGYGFRDLIQAVVSSLPFESRRGDPLTQASGFTKEIAKK
jgi:Protein of unknown function (DUF1592)/Protein of unknown function (DUF1588)/Protein of unknown function (DUF1585)/Protein of unknown function (DUF1587)/Protein of unknown function (DUF1595)